MNYLQKQNAVRSLVLGGANTSEVVKELSLGGIAIVNKPTEVSKVMMPNKVKGKGTVKVDAQYVAPEA